MIEVNSSRAIAPVLETRPAPGSHESTVVAVRPASVQLADPVTGPIATVYSGTGSRRVSIATVAQLAGTVETAITAETEELWLTDRDWFVDRVGEEIVSLDSTLAGIAGVNGIRFRAWTTAATPAHVEVYGNGKRGQRSPDPALDGPCE